MTPLGLGLRRKAQCALGVVPSIRLVVVVVVLVVVVVVVVVVVELQPCLQASVASSK